MTRDNEGPAEKQSEISPSSEILHPSPFPQRHLPAPCLLLHQHMGSRKAGYHSCIPSPQDSGCT